MPYKISVQVRNTNIVICMSRNIVGLLKIYRERATLFQLVVNKLHV